MTVDIKSMKKPPRDSKCRGEEAYRWMHPLPRLGWAWEFLRRNPDYRSDFAAHTTCPAEGSFGLDNSVDATQPAWRWPTVRPEDPSHDARSTNVMWCRDVCTAVLPIAAVELPPDATSRPFSFDRINCRIAVHTEADRKHVLFAEDGRFLQLEISGAEDVDRVTLVTPALPDGKLASNRLLAVKRLSDAMTHGQLRPSLYPPEKRAPRLMRVIQALDGWSRKASYREIGIALFGQARVECDWQHPGNHLRDQVRRAIGYGRELMDGGYVRFLT